MKTRADAHQEQTPGLDELDEALDEPPPPSHRVRHATALVLAAGLVITGIVYAGPWAAGLVAGALAQESTAPTCTPLVVPAPKPGAIAVNVYNGSDRPGVATDVARQLRLRDFSVKRVGNDPALAVIDDAAQIRFGPKGAAAAQVLSWQVKGADLVNDYRSGAGVDFVIGTGYTALLPAAPTPLPGRATFTLNVFNTTFRTGLAGDTARQLERRGFKPGKSANDPLRSMVSGVGELRFGDRGERQASLVADQLPGLSTRNDGRSGTSVDLVLGNGYQALLPVSQVPVRVTPKDTTPRTVDLGGC